MFNDDDFKRLKECIHPREPFLWVSLFNQRTNSTEKIDLVALLHRLECAELCAGYLDAIHETDRSPRENEALIAWQQSKGAARE